MNNINFIKQIRNMIKEKKLHKVKKMRDKIATFEDRMLKFGDDMQESMRTSNAIKLKVMLLIHDIMIVKRDKLYKKYYKLLRSLGLSDKDDKWSWERLQVIFNHMKNKDNKSQMHSAFKRRE